jgi:hypothetical protein
MATPTQPGIERRRYWQGQKLGSSDFRAQAEIETQLRAWHNRAMHNAFGISQGLGAKPIPERGSVTGFKVECGVAYDCFGRELLLQTASEVAVPQADSQPLSSITLLLRYRETSEYLSKKEMGAACGLGTCGSSTETAEFLWKLSTEVQSSDGVPLARLNYESTSELQDAAAINNLTETQRSRLRYDKERKLLIYKGVMSSTARDELLGLTSNTAFKEAVKKLFESSQEVPRVDNGFLPVRTRRLARPRIGNGNTTPGGTEWEIWAEVLINSRRARKTEPIGVQVTIDTSAAGFTEQPCYFAWLEGELWSENKLQFFSAPLGHIDNATTRQFRFRIWLPTIIAPTAAGARIINKGFETEFLNFARRQKLYVCWLGIQPSRYVFECATPEEFECRTVNEE